MSYQGNELKAPVNLAPSDIITAPAEAHIESGSHGRLREQQNPSCSTPTAVVAYLNKKPGGVWVLDDIVHKEEQHSWRSSAYMSEQSSTHGALPIRTSGESNRLDANQDALSLLVSMALFLNKRL